LKQRGKRKMEGDGDEMMSLKRQDAKYQKGRGQKLFVEWARWYQKKEEETVAVKGRIFKNLRSRLSRQQVADLFIKYADSLKGSYSGIYTTY
jgi:hypothetical protein